MTSSVAPPLLSPPSDPVAPRPRWRDRLAAFGRPPRVMGVDVARGLAVFGMIGAHVGSTAQLDWTDASTWTGVVDGRSSILFALVAGVSLALTSGGRTRLSGGDLDQARLRLAGRGLVVLGIGLVLELLGTYIGVILPLYGVLFFAMSPFLGWSRRALLLMAGALALLGPTAVAVVEALTLGPTGAGLELLVNGAYTGAAWMSLMLAGMALGRCDLTSRRLAAGLVAGGVLLAGLGYGAGHVVDGGAGAVEKPWSVAGVAGVDVDLTGMTCVDMEEGILVCGPGAGGAGDLGSSPVAAAPESYAESLAGAGGLSGVPTTAWSAVEHSGGTPEIVGSGGFAAAILGLCLLLARPLRWLLVPVAAVGSMPLTAYTVHVVSVAVLIAPFALMPSRWTGAGGEAAFPLWGASVIVLLVACTAWAVLCGRGPLERLTARGSRAALAGRPGSVP